MPIFEYRCEACGEKFDRFYRSLEEEAREKMICPSCGSDRLRKLISFSGWAATRPAAPPLAPSNPADVPSKCSGRGRDYGSRSTDKDGVRWES